MSPDDLLYDLLCTPLTTNLLVLDLMQRLSTKLFNGATVHIVGAKVYMCLGIAKNWSVHTLIRTYITSIRIP